MSNRSVETLHVPDTELLTYSNPTEPAKHTLNPHLLLLDQPPEHTVSRFSSCKKPLYEYFK